VGERPQLGRAEHLRIVAPLPNAGAEPLPSTYATVLDLIELTQFKGGCGHGYLPAHRGRGKFGSQPLVLSRDGGDSSKADDGDTYTGRRSGRTFSRLSRTRSRREVTITVEWPDRKTCGAISLIRTDQSPSCYRASTAMERLPPCEIPGKVHVDVSLHPAP